VRRAYFDVEAAIGVVDEASQEEKESFLASDE